MARHSPQYPTSLHRRSHVSAPCAVGALDLPLAHPVRAFAGLSRCRMAGPSKRSLTPAMRRCRCGETGLGRFDKSPHSDEVGVGDEARRAKIDIGPISQRPFHTRNGASIFGRIPKGAARLFLMRSMLPAPPSQVIFRPIFYAVARATKERARLALTRLTAIRGVSALSPQASRRPLPVRMAGDRAALS